MPEQIERVTGIAVGCQSGNQIVPIMQGRRETMDPITGAPSPAGLIRGHWDNIIFQHVAHIVWPAHVVALCQ
jgi:hypothetical protein